jgi:PH/SEC7 domain-containing protein
MAVSVSTAKTVLSRGAQSHLSTGVVHQVCYSLLLLNTDLHVAELASHMSRNQFVRNTIDTIRSQSQDDKGNQSDLALNSARASSPEPVPTTEDNASVYSVSINGSDARGSVSDSGTTHTIRKSRRSESITSKRSNPIMSLSTPMASSANHSAGSGSDPTDFARRPSIQVHGTTSSGTSTVYDRNWETEMETMLKVRIVSFVFAGRALNLRSL